MGIRLNYYTDRDPEILHTNPDPRKLLTKFNVSKFCGKKHNVLTVLTDIEQQLYIKLAKVPRGQLRSQKSCKIP